MAFCMVLGGCWEGMVGATEKRSAKPGCRGGVGGSRFCLCGGWGRGLRVHAHAHVTLAWPGVGVVLLGVDGLDDDLGEVLAVALLDARALAALHLEGDELRSAEVLDDLEGNGGAGDGGGSDGELVVIGDQVAPGSSAMRLISISVPGSTLYCLPLVLMIAYIVVATPWDAGMAARCRPRNGREYRDEVNSVKPLT